MDDTLTGLSQLVEQNTRRPDPAVTVDLALRVERFARRVAAEGATLDPQTHIRLLTRLARTIDPVCPAGLEQARGVLGRTALGTLRG